MFTLTDTIYDIIKKEPEKIELFSQAFGCGAEEITLAVSKMDEQKAAEIAAAEKAARIRAKAAKLDEFRESIKGTTINKAVLSVLDSAAEMGDALSDDDSKVVINVGFARSDDNKWFITVSATGTEEQQEIPTSRGGTRVRYNYFDGGAPIQGHLKRYILEKCGDSVAAQEIRGGDKLIVWDVVQRDPVLANRITRSERTGE